MHIEVIRGEVAVRGWDRDEVKVSGWLDARMEEFVFEVRGNETEIEVKLPHRLNDWGSGSSDLHVFVPRNSNVEVGGVSTDIDVADIQAGIRAHSVSGEVDVSNVAKRINLSSVSGDVTLEDADGRISARTVSGDLEARDVKGRGSYDSVSGSISIQTSGEELDLETVSGNIEATLQQVKELVGNTVSGDIEISGDLQSGGNIDLESVSGTVELALDDDTDARFDIETGSGGRIRNRLTNDQPKVSKYSRDSMLRFVMGDGSGEVVISTASGRVVLDSSN
ncbi:MAG: DUF4097 family beta strand repeat-containing protein [Pseudomonadales bacterium]|jgi:DUF4097 and DUF4098 domain-containing protein YvlB|nr:DUF4097 family beta strand repeat-containing protein [Pseudomonadales bacterium]MDP7360951.1 DUF4097 family beta strand repeat-containing protein [Pseudomonadales bacterium]MDP7595277.1 DUF4097 family beta strand repeat-containing protein [Pseudomonadales bacterium]HJN49539.1 DUF4097 family beta strand repeat-containing protein [Pseudomonadales bacterium]|tara:strand:- start:5947 stop:6786 length:840 start_codon:yes stop_codon:yes gene_type:complete